MTISPHARIGALLGLLLTVLTAGTIYVLSGNSHTATTVTQPTIHHTKPTPPIKVVTPQVNPLLPAPLHLALEHNPVVVAAFYNPHASVDALTVLEARAGALQAHVGFVPVNLMDDSVAGPLTALLPDNELLPNPGIAIYERSGTIVYRSDGFLTSAAVAQAVKDFR